ncbi:MAG: amidohydrolase [Clostridiales bacterium]|jgi:amidohydrolase|nr:amidohydrolase [Clostridiales bacterium]
MDIKNRALNEKDFMTLARRFFHEHPELGLKEYITTKYIKGELEAMGVPLQDVDIETGCVAIIKGEKPGKDIVTAIRADIDALPLEEKTGVEYSSKHNNTMHACGHDGHTATLLGVAKVLNGIKSELSGTVKLVFQPAEEGAGGAKKMIEKGGLDNPKPEEIIALHAWPGLNVGQIGIMPEKAMASADSFNIKIIGRGGHGARPSESVNPIYAAAAVINAVTGIVSNEVSTFDSVVVSVCNVHAGQANNVIPDDIKIGGTVRCLEDTNRDFIKQTIERFLKGVCESYRCTYEFEYKKGVSALFNDPSVIERISTAASKIVGAENVIDLKNPTMGSEDFSDLTKHVGKGAMIRLGVGTPGVTGATLHNDKFNFNDDALPVGCAVLCQYILDRHQD